MMSLWKLRVGVESYYLAQIASGLDEYYTGAGEAAGRWTGTGSALLGLDGEVASDDLRAVLAGLAPNTGLTPNGTQAASHPRRVPGFDLTFAVPKSVSTVYALGDPLVQQAVIASCEAALAASLSWLEREACFVRRGTNNRELVRDPAEFGTRRMVGEGFVAAQFPHRTSRLGDPHLHWHVLVANTARGIDGRWTALDGTALYRSQRTVGVLFQTAMRRELSLRLGVEWGPVHNDSAEIAGIPARVLREFSQRHEQIAEWLDTTGRSGPEAAGQALLVTRTSKQHLDDFAVLEVGWRTRAEQLGWGPAALDQLLTTAPGLPASPDGGQRWVIRDTAWRAGESTPLIRTAGFDEWLDWLLTNRVTEKTGTFTRFELTQAVAATLPPGTALAEVEATVARALASPAVIQTGDHWRERRPVHAPGRIVCDDRELRYTAGSLLAVEQRLLIQLTDGAQAGVGILDPTAVEAAIAASTLGVDQAAAVRTLTSTGDRVAVMVGRAGTGKTHTLGTLRDVYEQAGWEVIGVAPSARAARELQDGSGITSTTIARHLVEQRPITATTLVVIDEAAMAATRDLAALVDQATTVAAKVVLVGDHHQLPEVAAGGAFRAALDTLGSRVVELTINRRQQHVWEQAALDELRCGDVATAFGAYRDHGRVIITDTPDDLHAIVLADWHAARTNGDAMLLAGTRAEARLLNRYARHMLGNNGELDLDHEISFAGRGFTLGDHVVMCRNHPHQHLTNGDDFAVDNGMRGTITDLSPAHMTVAVTSGEHVLLDNTYLEHGWVDHAYAVTIHKAQGVTCDYVFVVGPAGLYREGAYVAMSRARYEAWLYATSLQAAEIEGHRHGIPLPTEPDPDPEAELVARLHITAAKHLVIIDDPQAPIVAELVATVPASELLRRARHAATAEHQCGVDNPATARAEIDAAVAVRLHLATGRRIRAVDRDNVGHVLAIDDTAGTCTVHFESVDGRTAVRTLDWAELVVIDHPDPVALTDQAAATLARRTVDVEVAEHAWAVALGRYGVTPGDADLYRRTVHTAADHAARSLHADPPAWLTTWLGPRPQTPAAASVWDDATTGIAHHRLIHDIDDNDPGIGPRPIDATASDHWQDLMIRLLEDRIWLADHPKPDLEPPRVAGPTELIERQHELQQLLASAPADQRQFIDRIVTSQLDPTEIHDYLTAAMAVQDARRDWIISNWPHLIELEQVTQLIAHQKPLAHWPTAQPDHARGVLEQLRQLAPRLDVREERTLADLNRHEVDNDPVLKLEARRNHIRQLAARTASPAEHDAIETELASLNDQLRSARREQLLQQTFDRYLPTATDQARATRITTLAHDTLTTEPAWVVEHIRYLHDNDQLTTCDVPALATRIKQAAIALDQGGQLPEHWSTPEPTNPDVHEPALELG